MASDSNPQRKIASTLLTGLIGASLIYYARRNKGLLAAIGSTVGYSLVTKAVSTTIITALESSRG
ncbi:MAG TPA: hypothetical protein VIM62_00175 [Acidobacteriaceae bacterium]